MKDFVFYNPVKIVFGRDKTDLVGGELKPYGKKLLLVYGRESIKKSGLYDRVKKSLAAAGIEALDHEGVKSNPVLSHTEKGIKKAKENGIDCVLAVGGGSVMDEAKAIAAGAVVDHSVWDFLSGAKKVAAALPVITVPTLAASGSEMNGNLVITNEMSAEKLAIYSPLLFPKCSILDPMLTVTVPADYTFYGVADAFSHVVEPYFNGEEHFSVLQDQIAEGIFRSLMDVGRRLSMNLQDYKPRADMMWTASVALLGIVAAGRGKTRWENHLLAHALSALHDVPHGAALSVIMPGWMKFFMKRRADKLAKFAVEVMGAQRGADNAATALNGIDRFKQWLKFIGAPVQLADLGIHEHNLPDICKNAADNFQRAGMVNLGEAEAGEILRNCL